MRGAREWPCDRASAEPESMATRENAATRVAPRAWPRTESIIVGFCVCSTTFAITTVRFESGCAMRTVIVGDVHGCLDELLALVERCGDPGDTRYVMVGDLVAKGPDSKGVVAWARASNVEAVLGNHDAAVLRVRDPDVDPPAKAHH